MSFIRAGLQFIQMIFAKLWSLLSALLSFFFGSVNYQAPSWMKWCGSKLNPLRLAFIQKPLKGLGILALIATLAAGGWQGWTWYKSRPQPVTVKVTVTVPTRTQIEDNLPPNPLKISFDSSVAPIEQVGKIISAGVNIMPKIEGVWKWDAENELSFQPKAD
ncbi:MAG: hypothetical protein V4440_07995, partial [Pseudomonadota bacterium]